MSDQRWVIVVRDFDGELDAVRGPYTETNAAVLVRQLEGELATEQGWTPESAPDCFDDEGHLVDDGGRLFFDRWEMAS